MSMYQKDYSLHPDQPQVVSLCKPDDENDSETNSDLAEGGRPSGASEVTGRETTPEYEQQRLAYETLWQSTTPTLPAPASPVKLHRPASKAALKERFQRMVGAETFIPDSKLKSVRTIGSGSFATVEICNMEIVPGKKVQQVAVKRLKPNSGIGINDLASEARILGKLRHRNIVEYIGIGYNENTQSDDPASGFYLVQEYVDGGTLKMKVLARPPTGKRAYSYSDAIRWCCDIAEGLTYLHGVNPVVLHRDLKAENILLRHQESGGTTALICDFGLAVSVLNPDLQRRRSQLSTTKSMHHFFAASPEPLAVKQSMKEMPKHLKQIKSQKLDKELNNFVSKRSMGFNTDHVPPKPPEAIYDLTGGTGSYCYMAPEITLCKPYNEKVDCFSFGVIIWELFQHTTTSSIVLQTGDYDACALYAHKVAGGFRQPLPHRWPRDLCDIISDCWREQASERPPMKDILLRLKRLRDSGTCDAWDERSAFGVKFCGCFSL